MAVQVFWHTNDKTIIQQRYIGTSDVPDFIIMIEQTYNLLNSVPHPVDIIVNVEHNTTPLTRALMILSANIVKRLRARQHPNRRFIVIVGADESSCKIIDTISRSLPDIMQNYYFVDTLADAENFIYSYERYPVGRVD